MTSATCSSGTSALPTDDAAEDVHALDLDGLLDPAITFYSVRLDGDLFGVGAIKELDPEHAELKSMHTAAAARRRGVARALVEHLVEVVRERGARRVSIETGTGEAFVAARSLYASAGFVPCGPFGDYTRHGEQHVHDARVGSLASSRDELASRAARSRRGSAAPRRAAGPSGRGAPS